MSDTARSDHLSIGEVLALVQEDFPDVTISKIRFLESQGLIAPERTGAGFRKFYETDIERLRWILRQQGDHFLPLKVIKRMLEDGADPSAGVQTQPTLWSSTESDQDPPGQTPSSGTSAAEAPGGGGSGSTGQSGSATSEPGHDGRYRSPAHPAVASSPLAKSADVGADTSSTGPAGSDPSSTPDRGSGPGGSGDSGSGGDRGRHASAASPSSSNSGAGAASQGTADQGTSGREPSGSGSSRGDTSDRGGGGAVGSDPGGGRQGGGQRTLSTPADVVAALQEDPRPKRRQPDRDGGAAAETQTSDPAHEPEDQMTPSSAENSGQVQTPLTRSELCELCNIPSELLDALEQFGFVSSTSLGGVHVYDDGAVAVTRIAARYAELGIEPRHLRMYKIAAEREAGMIEQLVVPLLKQRNPTARQNAAERSQELAAMGAELHGMLLGHQLRGILGS